MIYLNVDGCNCNDDQGCEGNELFSVHSCNLETKNTVFQ